MKKYTYLIIDDNPLDRVAAGYHLKKYPFLQHKASLTSAKEGLSYLEKNKVDILFLDIDMPGMSGIEFLKKVKDDVICSVFITSHSEFALEGFELKAFDFLVKPLIEERVDECLNRLEEYLDIQLKAKLFEHSFRDDSILIKEGSKYISVRFCDVVYLEALKDYTRINMLNKKKSTIYGNLGTILNDDNFKHFIRIHKSYAIQKNFIQEIKSNEILLVNGVKLPLGLSYRRNLLDILT